METVLAPWLPVLDKFSPDWRCRLHGHTSKPRDIDLYVSKYHYWKNKALPLPCHEEQLRLREAVELLAVALAVDGTAFLAAFAGDQLDTKTSRQFAAHERLKLRLEVDTKILSGEGYYQDFIGGWSEEDSSMDYQDAKKSLLHLQDKPSKAVTIPTRLYLSLCVKLKPRGTEGLACLTRLLQMVSNDAFHVTDVALDIEDAAYERSTMVELFTVVERFKNDGASIRVEVDLPGDDDNVGVLAHWKTLFDLVTRRRHLPVGTTSDCSSGDWDLHVSCSEMDSYGDWMLNQLMDASGSIKTDARLAVACFSALAHADTSVTSVHIDRALEEDDDEDDIPRRIRTKSVAYLLLAGSLETLSVSDKEWDEADALFFEELFRSQSRQDQLWQMWNEEWLDDEHASIDVSDAAYFLEDTSDLLGVMNPRDLESDNKSDSDPESDPESQAGATSELVSVKEDSEVEIWLAGYGQCKMPRQLVDSALERQRLEQQPRLQPQQPILKEFSLNLYGNEQQRAPVCRVVEVIGATLEELNISISSVRFPVSFLSTVIRACPRLRQLSVDVEAGSSSTRESPVEAITCDPHPLSSLTLRVAAASAVPGVFSILQRRGVRLTDLRVSGAYAVPQEPSSTDSPTDARVLATSFKDVTGTLKTLQISNLRLRDVRGELPWNDTSVHPGLTYLFVDNAIWEEPELLQFIEALSCGDHPLARSLYTLRSRLTSHTHHLAESVFRMLKTNRFLAQIDLILPSTASHLCDLALETNRMSIQRHQSRLPLKSKLTVLWCLNKTSMHWENEAIARVFAFAAHSKQRRVAITFAK